MKSVSGTMFFHHGRRNEMKGWRIVRRNLRSALGKYGTQVRCIELVHFMNHNIADDNWTGRYSVWRWLLSCSARNANGRTGARVFAIKFQRERTRPREAFLFGSKWQGMME